MNKVLYISYDGMMEPLGQSQVLQYLKKLASSNKFFLVSYEKREDWVDSSKKERLKKTLSMSGISWTPLCYHKSPSGLATAYDLLIGVILCFWLAVRYKIQIVHARSYVSSVIALVLKKSLGKKFIFDMRGFWADERIDGRIWPKNSRMFKIAKWFEKSFLINSDVIVSLTHTAVDIMKEFSYLKNLSKRFVVIPTCTNTELFKPREKDINEQFTLGYVGSVGTWYMFDEVIECFKHLLEIKPNSQLLVINKENHDYICKKLGNAGVCKKQYKLISVEYSNVGNYISMMNAGIFFIKPVFSKMASCPTKMGEFLACGIPCIANSGVGDVEKILCEENVGVVVSEFSSKTLSKAIIRIIDLASSESVKTYCVSIAHKYFSLDLGVQKYQKIYKLLS